jgi:hypothetical protein
LNGFLSIFQSDKLLLAYCCRNCECKTRQDCELDDEVVDHVLGRHDEGRRRKRMDDDEQHTSSKSTSIMVSMSKSTEHNIRAEYPPLPASRPHLYSLCSQLIEKGRDERAVDKYVPVRVVALELGGIEMKQSGDALIPNDEGQELVRA